MAQRTKYISIVSGKGGTGKTLLSAVLGRSLAKEGHRILLVDFDIFVRGLSILLSGYYRIQDNVNKSTVTELLYEKNENDDLAIGRFMECDFLPATHDIGEPINFKESFFLEEKFFDKNFGRFKEHCEFLGYDMVIFDCRAGVDNGIIQICKHSDIILSVAEDDDVCIQANANLINYLRFNEKARNIFTIINKGRRLTSLNEVKKSNLSRIDFNCIGIIPFDMEVMQDFGKDRFWNTINETLYIRALVYSWNTLSQKTNLPELSTRRLDLPSSLFLSNRQGRFNLFERMMRVYAIIFSVIGIGSVVVQFLNDKFHFLSITLNFNQIAVGSLAMAAIFYFFMTLDIRRILLGKTDYPDEMQYKQRKTKFDTEHKDSGYF